MTLPSAATAETSAQMLPSFKKTFDVEKASASLQCACFYGGAESHMDIGYSVIPTL